MGAMAETGAAAAAALKGEGGGGILISCMAVTVTPWILIGPRGVGGAVLISCIVVVLRT